jgi:hypothetical protein
VWKFAPRNSCIVTAILAFVSLNTQAEAFRGGDLCRLDGQVRPVHPARRRLIR